MKRVRVKLNRVMDPIDGMRRPKGYETTLPEPLALVWARNKRITILADGTEKARPKAGAADPTKAPPSGSPAGRGAVSSSSLPVRPQVKKTGIKRGRPPKASPPAIDPFG